MKKLIAILMALSFNASAAFVFDAGTFKFTGDNYIASNGPVGVGAESFGIGRILNISEGSNTVWTTGQNGEYLNYVFGGFNTDVFTSMVPGINFFSASGGTVQFFLTNDASVFNVLNNPLATIAAITSSGSLWLDTVAVGNTTGTVGLQNYGGNGFLNVVGGTVGPQLNTNTRPIDFTNFADLTFGLAGARNQNPLVNSAYLYNTSADVQGSAVTIPEPASLMLIGLGLLAFATIGRKRYNFA
jgi:hypothetical protein